MAKTALHSSERLALAHAHEQRRAAEAALVEAESAHQMSRRDRGGATWTIVEIEERIAKLRNTRTYGLPQLREDVGGKLEEARAALEAARAAAMPFGIAEEQARARVTSAEQSLMFAQGRVRSAAEAVVRAESGPVVDDLTERLQQAYRVIASCGDDLRLLVEKGLTVSPIAKETTGPLVRNPAGWLEFEVRQRQSPWNGAVAALEQDPQALLPLSAS